MKALMKFVRDERGMETVEYAVMTALIVAALVAAISALSAAVEDRFGEVEDTIGQIEN